MNSKAAVAVYFRMKSMKLEYITFVIRLCFPKYNEKENVTCTQPCEIHVKTSLGNVYGNIMIAKLNMNFDK